MKKQLVVMFAAFSFSACEKPVTVPAPSNESAQASEANTERANRAEAFDQNVDTFVADAKQTLAKLDSRLQRATERVDKAAANAEQDTKRVSKQMGNDADTALTDIKTRLDKLGEDVDRLGDKTGDELKGLKSDIKTRLDRLDRETQELVDDVSDGS